MRTDLMSDVMAFSKGGTVLLLTGLLILRWCEQPRWWTFRRSCSCGKADAAIELAEEKRARALSLICPCLSHAEFYIRQELKGEAQTGE